MHFDVKAALSDALQARGLTQYRVATEAGVDRAQLNKVLLGLQGPSDELLDKVAPVLGLDAEELKARRDAADPAFRVRAARVLRWVPDAFSGVEPPAAAAAATRPPVGADLRDKATPIRRGRNAWAIPAGVTPSAEERALMRRLDPGDLLELGPAYVADFWKSPAQERVAAFRQWIADNEAAGHAAGGRAKA